MKLTRLMRPWFTTSAGALAILSVAAFMTRLLPLSMSQYPWNNDSLTECAIATEIANTGHLNYSPDSPWFGTHALATPAFNAMLAFIASALGSTPIEIGQVTGAAMAVPMIGAFFLLGRLFSGDVRGGIAASLMGVLMGTFVFTTGSIWKVTPGILLLLVAVIAYVNRSSPRFRILTVVVLFLIPLTHHLVTAVAIILLGYVLVWSWFFTLTKKGSKRGVLMDTVTIGIPAAASLAYYASVNLDRMVQYSEPIKLALIASGFAAVSILAIIILSLRSHVKGSFAPFVGVGVVALILMDYFGFIFPYDPSASEYYVLLGLASALIVALAWYGSEVMLERGSAFRAVQVSLLLSPVTIIGYGFIQGFSLDSHQVLYRTFDLLDVFLFLGTAVALVWFYKQRKKLYVFIGLLLVISLAISFPFGYYSEQLLGVRHDTQAYEIDSLLWLQDHHDGSSILSDERLGYVARSTIWVTKDSSLPRYLATDSPLPFYNWYYVMEDSWTTEGVNDYPNGLLVADRQNFNQMLLASDLMYIGGPMDDRIYLFTASYMGYNTLYGQPLVPSTP